MRNDTSAQRANTRRLALLALWIRAVLRNYRWPDGLWILVVVVLGVVVLLLPILAIVLLAAAPSKPSRATGLMAMLLALTVPDVLVVGLWLVVLLWCFRLHNRLAAER